MVLLGLLGAVEATPPQRAFVNGPFLGLNVGIAQLNAKLNEVYAPGQTRRFRHAATSATGGLHLGWGSTFGMFDSCWYGALMGEAALSGLRGRDDSNVNAVNYLLADKTTTRERYNFALAAKLGRVIFSQTLLFVRLGVRFSTFKFSQNFVLNDLVNPPITFPQTSFTQMLAGFEPGVGISTRLCENWTLTGEYTYTFYGKKSFSTPTFVDPNNPDNTAQANGSVRPQIGRFMLSLTHHF